MMRTVRILFLAVATSLASSSIAESQNLVPNPNFDDDLSGWSFVETEIWTADDANGQPDSGSAEITVDVAAVQTDAILACIPVDAGETYSFGAAVKLTISDGAGGDARVVPIWYADEACTAFFAGEPAFRSTNDAPDWTRLDGVAVAPTGAAACALVLEVRKLSGIAGPAVSARFDDVVFAAGACGDPVLPGQLTAGDPELDASSVTATDALFILRVSVGLEACDDCLCNVNAVGGITATDALTVLQYAVGIVPELSCPPCS